MLGNRKVGAASSFSSTLCREVTQSHSPHEDRRSYSLTFSSPHSAFNTDFFFAFRANESTGLPARARHLLCRVAERMASRQRGKYPVSTRRPLSHSFFPAFLKYMSYACHTPGPPSLSTLLSLGGHVTAIWHLGWHLISCILKFPQG